MQKKLKEYDIDMLIKIMKIESELLRLKEINGRKDIFNFFTNRATSSIVSSLYFHLPFMTFITLPPNYFIAIRQYVSRS